MRLFIAISKGALLMGHPVHIYKSLSQNQEKQNKF